jgi:hypothetical protein
VWGGTDSQQGFFTLYCAIVLVGEKYGTGRLAADISQQDFQISMKVLSQSRVYIYIYIYIYGPEILMVASCGIVEKLLIS